MNKTPISYSFFRTDKPKEEGFSHEIISDDYNQVKDKTTMDELYVLPHDGKIDTLLKGLQKQLKEMPNHELLGSNVNGTYQWKTVQQVHDIAKQFSQGCVKLGLSPEIEAEGKQWKFLGIQSKNREHWVLTHIGNMFQRVTTVALYDTLGEAATKYIFDQTEMTSIACSGEYVAKLTKIKQDDAAEAEKTSNKTIDIDNEPVLDEEGNEIPQTLTKMHRLANIITFDEVSKDDIAKAEEAGIKVHTFDEVCKLGKENPCEPTEPVKDDVFMFSYTSGTTGNPKGVKLQHKMCLMTSYAINVKFGKQRLSKDDTYISYLPAAHSFEQGLFGVVMSFGMKCGFYGGDPLAMVKNDLPALKPTIFPSVPRLYNRIYGRIQDQFKAATGCKACLISKAVKAKQDGLKNHGLVTNGCWDKIVFKKTKAILGGNVRLMVTGSAPISGEVLDFLKIAFCCPLIEGYGMTETSAGSCLTNPGDKDAGHVGGPVFNVKLRLRDIPEMNYLSTKDPPRGEVCFWGPSIMQGYFKNEEKTKESFHGDGWLLSGDVGQINPNGSLKIIDRAKNIFKLSQGEYIAPEKLENIYVQSSYLAQIWVHGDSTKDYCVMFAVVDPDQAENYAKQLGVKQENVCDNDTFRDMVYSDMMRLALDNKLNSLEKPKQFKLLLDPWTIESNILTPTMKLKRNIAKDMYKEDIQDLYSKQVIKQIK